MNPNVRNDSGEKINCDHKNNAQEKFHRMRLNKSQ